MKLHPFESVRQRQRMLNELLNKDERQLVSVTAAALSREILQNTWCGVTVESSTAVECATAAYRHSFAAGCGTPTLDTHSNLPASA